MMIWVLGIFGCYKEALLPIAIILIEVVVLIVNGWRCPLTNFAAKYAKERKDNFDIYLPNWLAKYNMAIFGSLFVASIIFTFFRWVGLLN